MEYEYKSFTKCYTITLAGNATPNNIGIQLDKDADFFLDAVQASYTGLPYAATFIDHTQYALSSGPVGSFAFAAATTGLAPVYEIIPAIMFPAGSAILMNLVEQSGSSNGSIQFLFRGVKRYVFDPRNALRGR